MKTVFNRTIFATLTEAAIPAIKVPFFSAVYINTPHPEVHT